MHPEAIERGNREWKIGIDAAIEKHDRKMSLYQGICPDCASNVVEETSWWRRFMMDRRRFFCWKCGMNHEVEV